MFSGSRRIVNVSLRASRLFTNNTLNNISLSSSTRLAFTPIKSIAIRTYATRKGASSRPVKTKEREETQQEAPLSTQYQQGQQTPGYYDQQYQQQQYPYEQQQYGYGQQTASEHITSNTSLQAFLKRSMVTTAAGVGVSAASCAVFMQIPAVLAHPYIAMGVGMVGAMGALFGMGMNQPQYVREGEVVRAIDSPARQALFGTLLVAEGLSFAPMIKIVSVMTPMAIPIAGALAVGTMAGMAAYALRQPQGALAKWGPALYVGVFGLLGAGIVNMFLHSSMLSMVTSAAGIAIFAGFTAYDTHTAIQDHNEGRPDHLLTAANFYLNFVNLFMYYLRIVQSFLDD